MSSHRVRFILAATLIAALAGCGQKGPLYLPADEVQPLPADGAAPADPAAGTVSDPAAAAPEAATEESGATQGSTN